MFLQTKLPPLFWGTYVFLLLATLFAVACNGGAGENKSGGAVIVNIDGGGKPGDQLGSDDDGSLDLPGVVEVFCPAIDETLSLAPPAALLFNGDADLVLQGKFPADLSGVTITISGPVSTIEIPKADVTANDDHSELVIARPSGLEAQCPQGSCSFIVTIADNQGDCEISNSFDLLRSFTPFIEIITDVGHLEGIGTVFKPGSLPAPEMGDIDEDGYVDIAMISHEFPPFVGSSCLQFPPKNISLLSLGQIAANSLPIWQVPLFADGDSGLCGIHADSVRATTADVNGDGEQDLVVRIFSNVHGTGYAVGAYDGTSGNELWRVSGQYIASQDEGLSNGNISEVVGLGDVNNDGFEDVIIASTDFQYKVLFAVSGRPNGSEPQAILGKFVVTSLASVVHGNSLLALGDLDEDGSQDFLLTKESSKAGDSYILSGAGIASGNPAGEDLFGTVVGYNSGIGAGHDVDDDGKDDLFLIDGSGNVSLFSAAEVANIMVSGGPTVGGGDSLFNLPVQILANISSLAITERLRFVGDVDGDGESDIMIQDGDASNHAVISGADFQTLLGTLLIPGGLHFRFGPAGDLNNDGFMDIYTFADIDDSEPGNDLLLFPYPPPEAVTGP